MDAQLEPNNSSIDDQSPLIKILYMNRTDLVPLNLQLISYTEKIINFQQIIRFTGSDGWFKYFHCYIFKPNIFYDVSNLVPNRLLRITDYEVKAYNGKIVLEVKEFQVRLAPLTRFRYGRFIPCLPTM